MVTIKIQSLDDIVTAYLRGLGFNHQTAQKQISVLKKYLPQDSDSGDEVIRCLDELLYHSAQSIFKDSSLDKPQLIALLKFCYLRSSGAQKWGAQIFESSQLNGEISAALHKEIIHVAPNYVLSHMEPQSIVIPHPGQLITKMFKHKKIKKSNHV